MSKMKASDSTWEKGYNSQHWEVLSIVKGTFIMDGSRASTQNSNEVQISRAKRFGKT